MEKRDGKDGHPVREAPASQDLWAIAERAELR